MSNRTYNQTVNTIFKRVVTVYPIVAVSGTTPILQKVTFRAVGAVGTTTSSILGDAPTTGGGYVVGDYEGMRTVARTGAGAWTFTLSDPFQRLLGVNLIQTSNATGLLTSGFGVGVKSGTTNVTTNTGTGNGGVIAIALNNGSGAAADPADGDVLTFEITLLDATEP